jgi:hypothetical protein
MKIDSLLLKSAIGFFAMMAILAPNLAAAESPVTIAANIRDLANGIDIPVDFTGLSFETSMILPRANGKYYFTPENKALVAMFKMLGIRNLRVGGNTADRETVPVPTEKDLDTLFAFAKAADMKIIYTLRMKKGDPKIAAGLAKYIMDHYSSNLTCFTIGNEPNMFATEYPKYRDLWKEYMEAIVAPGYAPDAKFCGTSTTPGKAAWSAEFAKDFAASGRIALVTQHDYPGASARRVTDPADARERMLSADWLKIYQRFHDKFVPTVLENKLPYRLEEANSYFHGGAKDASDTFTSTLWALDYMYWWALHQASGINFHTGDNPDMDTSKLPTIYATYQTSPGGYKVRPIAYAMKAFDLGARGRIAPASIASNPDNINLTAYSVLGEDTNLLYVTVINKEHGPKARDASITIIPGKSASKAEAIFVTAPGGDVSLTSGVTIGGAEIKDDASWNGTWTALAAPSSSGEITVKVPAATAAVVKITSSDAVAQASQNSPHRAAWMKGARWGVMTHYLADWRARADKEQMSVENWNRMIDNFDVEGLAKQLESVGAGYYLITIGQGSGYYLAPNATYDKISGVVPSKCSTRDLVSDLYEPLNKRGIKLMVYLPAGGLRGQYRDPQDTRRSEAQLKWEQVISDWSNRFGNKVVGWWFDGCYTPNGMYRFSDPPNFKSFAEAARAGNPNSALAFNPGVINRALSITPYEDYTGGEINLLERASMRRHVNGIIDGAQIHYLSFLGQTWGMGTPRMTAEKAITDSLKVIKEGGAVTWDTPIQKSGLIAPEYMEQLTAIGKAIGRKKVE